MRSASPGRRRHLRRPAESRAAAPDRTLCSSCARIVHLPRPMAKRKWKRRNSGVRAGWTESVSLSAARPPPRQPPGRRRSLLQRFDWKDLLIGLLWLMLWTTNRRRTKPKFDLHGRADVEAMVPTFVGVTEGAIDRGNRVEILQNGAFFDRLLDDRSEERRVGKECR